MKIKPKEVLLNMPIVLMFDDTDKIAEFASNINTVLHGKQRLKFDMLGRLGDKYAGIFYLYRDHEYQDLRNEFIEMIEAEEMSFDKPQEK